MQNEHFVSMACQWYSKCSNQLKKDFLSIINPEFKFNNKTYTEVDEIIKKRVCTPKYS
jgi:hypothetical protein